MEKVSCIACKAYYVKADGTRHECRLGHAIKCNGINKFISTISFAPVKKCPRPLTDKKFLELRLYHQTCLNP